MVEHNLLQEQVFQPDWVWIKSRNDTRNHALQDSVRGTNKYLYGNLTDAEGTASTTLQSFDSDGFTLGTANSWNRDTYNFVSWNWLAGGTAPSQTYTVKVVSDSGNKYRFDDFGTSAVTLDLQEGGTYTFDQSDSSNSGHPLRFYYEADKTTAYTTGVTTSGTPGSSGAYTQILATDSTPEILHYQCSAHGYMGNQVSFDTRTNTGLTTDTLTEGSSNLYFTNARARSAISAGGDLSYNSSTGVMSFTQRTDAQVRGLVSVTDSGGDGSSCLQQFYWSNYIHRAKCS